MRIIKIISFFLIIEKLSGAGSKPAPDLNTLIIFLKNRILENLLKENYFKYRLFSSIFLNFSATATPKSIERAFE